MADTEKLKEDNAVDLILGNNQKTQIVEVLEETSDIHNPADASQLSDRQPHCG